MLVETDFLARGNHFVSLFHIFPKESFIPIGGNVKYCFLFRAFFPAGENQYLNYRETYLKVLLVTIFFFFFALFYLLDIPVSESSFSVQKKRILTNSPFLLAEIHFLSSWNNILSSRDFCSICGNRQIQFWKNNHISDSDNWFSG